MDNYTLEQLVDVLDFKREVMDQMLLVSTLMAVLAMTVVAVLLSTAERGRLRATLLVVSTMSTLVFIFGTMLNACILPAMKRNATHSEAGQIRGLLVLSEIVVWTLVAGAALLFGSIGGVGFLYSKRVGWGTLGGAVAIVGVFVACCFYLDHAMRQ